MQAHIHTLSDLFDQLGLPSDKRAIDRFIATNREKTNQRAIDQLEIWNSLQAEFLRQARAEDADWAEVVDELSARLSRN